MKKIIFIAAMLTVATVLAAGLAVFPGSVQEAQANPCANEVSRGGNTGGSFNPQGDDDRECDFTGYFEFDENDD